MDLEKSQNSPENPITLGTSAAEDHSPLKRLAHCDGACHIDCWLHPVLPSLHLTLSFCGLPRMDRVQYTYDNANSTEEVS